jgi:hypothetical protein
LKFPWHSSVLARVIGKRGRLVDAEPCDRYAYYVKTKFHQSLVNLLCGRVAWQMSDNSFHRLQGFWKEGKLIYILRVEVLFLAKNLASFRDNSDPVSCVAILHQAF